MVPAVLSACLVLGTLACGPEMPTSTQEEPNMKTPTAEIPIEPGVVHLPADTVASRTVELAAGDFLRLLVHQRGLDVVLRLQDDEGRDVAVADSPYGAHGPDDLLFVAETGGPYRLLVEAGKAGAEGEVEMEEPVRRPAGERERRWVRADTLFRQGRALRRDRHQEAVDSLEAALAEFRRLELVRREAETLAALAITHQRTGADGLAAAFANRAAELFGQVGERRREALALDQAGFLHLQGNRLEAAGRDLEAALALFVQEGMDSYAGLCAGRIGSLQMRQGRVEEGLESFRRGLERLGDDEPRWRAVVLVDLAAARLDLRQPREALAAYDEALALAEASSAASLRLAALEGRLFALTDLGRLDEASELATILAAGVDAGDPSRLQVNALLTLGQHARRRGDLADARHHLEKALAAARTLDRVQSRAVARLELGYLALLEGEPAAALEHLDRALELFREAGDRPGLASALARRGEALRDLGRLAEAVKSVDQALEEVETIRRSTGRRDVRLDYFGSRQDYYDLAVDLRMDQGAVAEALQVDERRRAQELKASLAAAGERGEPAGADLRAEEAALEERLVELAAGSGSGSAADAGRTDAEIAGVLAELHRVWSTLDATARRQPAPPPPPALDLEAYRARLEDETVVLVYALGEDRGHVWRLAADRPIEAAGLPGRDELARKVADFVRRARSPSSGDQVIRRRLGAELAAILLEPLWEGEGRRRLVLVPDGPLLGLPFAALPDPGDDERFLVESREIVLLPSLTALEMLRQNERQRDRPGRKVAVFADPVFSVEDPRLTGHGAETSAAPGRAELEERSRSFGVDLFQRLEGTAAEARSLRRRVPGDRVLVATGFEASRQAFLGLPFSELRILHLATHALADETHPELSTLLLSRFDAEGRPRDGFLRAYEIARLDLPLELVNLSACETGVGKVVPGEGVLALARAFLDAGTGRVLASLWKVGDTDTATLMSAFYEGYLDRGLTAPAALREAQLSMLARPDTATPYHWAAFALHGDWRPPANRAPGAPHPGDGP